MSYIKSFALYLSVEKDLAQSTISGYCKDVENFLDYTNKEVSSITSSDIRSYLAHLSKQDNAARSSMNRYLCSLKSFFGYLKDVEKVISDSPTDPIKLSKREKTLPKPISLADINKILETASTVGIKHRLLVELFYGLGGRVSEIASIKVEDIDFDNHFIKLLGKGNKERLNPIHEGCLDLLRAYMKAYGITEGYIFPHRLNPARHATREGLYLLVKGLASKAGVDPILVSPHVFRHSFATHLLDNGCDMALVQEYLGHEDISTTKIYAQVTQGNKTKTFRQFHPLAR